MLLSDLRHFCEQAGLNFRKIEIHRERVCQFLVEKKLQKCQIIETCRTDNYHILDERWFRNLRGDAGLGRIAHLIPAAGAGSRYALPLKELKDLDDLAVFQSMRQQGSAESLETLETFRRTPKGLLPATVDQKTFAEVKIEESRRWDPGSKAYFVVDPKFRSSWEVHLGSFSEHQILEQGAWLSTIRFLEDQSIATDKHGTPLTAPSGHGSLLELFGQIEEEHILIRNIDNVIGDREEIRTSYEDFKKGYGFLLGILRGLRACIRKGNVLEAKKNAQDVLLSLQIPCGEDPLETLNRIFFFGTDPLTDVFRPLTYFGVVANDRQQRGGLPLVTMTDQGPARVCVEDPHIPEIFRAELARSESYFNPVFVLVENHPDLVTKESDLWIVSEREYHGQKTFHHESALYEILGHSQKCNFVCTRIPNFFFNPHKSVEDTRGSSWSSWFAKAR